MPPNGRAMNPMAKVPNAASVPGEIRHLRKELGRKDDGSGRAVDEEVVPLDGGADPARDSDSARFERSIRDRRHQIGGHQADIVFRDAGIRDPKPNPNPESRVPSPESPA